MIERARTHELALGTNLVGYLGCQVAYLYGVLESAWCYLAHTSQQILVHVREFDERDVRRKPKGFFDDVE